MLVNSSSRECATPATNTCVTDAPETRPSNAPADASRTAHAHAALVVTEGDSIGRRMPLGDVPVVIGRGVGVDLQVSDPTVSRHHCVVWRASGRCWVRDLGSTNQTRVNNRSTRIVELFDGDVIVLGQTAFTLDAGLCARDRPR